MAKKCSRPTKKMSAPNPHTNRYMKLRHKLQNYLTESMTSTNCPLFLVNASPLPSSHLLYFSTPPHLFHHPWRWLVHGKETTHTWRSRLSFLLSFASGITTRLTNTYRMLCRKKASSQTTTLPWGTWILTHKHTHTHTHTHIHTHNTHLFIQPLHTQHYHLSNPSLHTTHCKKKKSFPPPLSYLVSMQTDWELEAGLIAEVANMSW